MKKNEPDFFQLARELGPYEEATTEQLARALEGTYDRGFADGLEAMLPARSGRHCICRNPDCGWKGDETQLRGGLMGIEDLRERLEPGKEIPAGQCPACEGLVYLTKRGAFQEIEATWLKGNVAAVLAEGLKRRRPNAVRLLFDCILSDDPYTQIAAFMFEKKPIEVNQMERDQVKVELFRLCYGGGA
jgi:hypothetical protein